MKKVIALLLSFSLVLFSQEASEQSIEEIAEAVESQLTDGQVNYLRAEGKLSEEGIRETGEIKILDGKARLEIPEGYYYLNGENARLLLEDLWGNPPSDIPLLGMIFPDHVTPVDPTAWGVTIEYSADGYVKDKDAEKINYDDLLEDMQESTSRENEYRVEAGYFPIALVGWASPPYYDAENKKLHWAKNLKFGEDEENTLNYNIRVLGREGFLVMNFIAGMDQLHEIQEAVPPVLAMADFTEGNTYADFQPGVDKVAAYGIGGLVAGKLLAKAGVFAKFLPFLKKGWILIFLVIGGVAKMFKGKNR